MELSDAFTTEAIQAAGTNVGGEFEEELREIIRSVYSANEIEGMEAGDKHEDVAVLAFIAGCTWQANEGPIRITMSSGLHARFLEFLNNTIEGMST